MMDTGRARSTLLLMLALPGLILFSGCASTNTQDFSEIADNLGYRCVHTQPPDGIETLLNCQNPNFEHLEFLMYETHIGKINGLKGVDLEYTSATDDNADWIVIGDSEQDVREASKELQR